MQCAAVRMWHCGSVQQCQDAAVCGSVRGGVQQCVRQCGAVGGSVGGSVWRCTLRLYTQSRLKYIDCYILAVHSTLHIGQ
jgi:hypothetical protein